MKTFIAWVICVLAIAGFVSVFVITDINDYHYEKKFGAELSLACRASTASGKLEHISTFIRNIESNRNEFADSSAFFYKTGVNSLEENLDSIKNLETRLLEIDALKDDAIGYSLAMDQIAKQRFSCAERVILNCWTKKSGMFCLIFPINFLACLACLVVFIAGAVLGARD